MLAYYSLNKLLVQDLSDGLRQSDRLNDLSNFVCDSDALKL